MKRLLNYTMELGDTRGPIQFNRLHTMLQAVFFAASSYAYARFGKTLLITSIAREGHGVHSVNRGIDADVCDGIVYEGGLIPLEAEMVAKHVNGLFIYDPQRPEMYCCFYSWRDDTGRHDNHLHFQVHPRTVPV